jgi:hypothetical protein
LADLCDRHVTRRPRRRQPALGQHHDLVAHLEELFQLLAHDEYRASFVAQLEQLAPDLCRRPDVHAPGGLRHHEHRGPGVDVAPHHELLQIAAREALGRRVGTAGLHPETFDDP